MRVALRNVLHISSIKQFDDKRENIVTYYLVSWDIPFFGQLICYENIFSVGRVRHIDVSPLRIGVYAPRG